MTVHILATLVPKPDRIARVEEIAREAAAHVQKNEPGTLKYQWFRAGTAEQPKVVVWEEYAVAAAFGTHKASPMMARFVEAEQKEQNLAAPLEVLPLEHFAGFANQDNCEV